MFMNFGFFSSSSISCALTLNEAFKNKKSSKKE
jgi:hypothetical protein